MKGSSGSTLHLYSPSADQFNPQEIENRRVMVAGHASFHSPDVGRSPRGPSVWKKTREWRRYMYVYTYICMYVRVYAQV